MSAPTYFTDAAALRAWFAAHAETAGELSVGFMKKDSGAPSITWPEAVDEALCVGWIDGVRHRVDDERYRIRFTPRRAGSIWSKVNIARVAVLEAEGRMQPAGRAAFERRLEAKSAIYAYEQSDTPDLDAAERKRLKADPAAWAFFEALPPGYRHKLVYWLCSAKQAATRERRFAQLLSACARGERL